MTDTDETMSWIERLDALSIDASTDEIRRVIAAAPKGAQQTSDYTYARGVVDARVGAVVEAAGDVRDV